MRVIGTAGHVDHGKSTLIAALTGIHPDRLKEEQIREMTIELGFGWLTLPSGEEVGIVDVPGHRDFIENMLSGIGGIDAALLVIAADEGIMPQTREHLAILDLLQIPSGLIVMTKIDVASDDGWLDLVEKDIRVTVSDTVLSDAPLIRVSAKTGVGLDGLISQLQKILEHKPARPDLHRPRLPVDRVFTMSGFGTVVTGTLRDGQLSTGDEVEILPSGLKGRIRGLQTHKKKEDVAIPGSRTAVNISGVSTERIQRGNVVAHPGKYQPTRRLDAQFKLLREASSPVKHGQEIKFFIGSSETIGTLRLLGVDELSPGESGWIQLELRNPIVALRGDYFILRRPSPGETLGGGKILDHIPQGRHKRFDENIMKSLESLFHGSPSDILLDASLELGIESVKNIINHSQLAKETAENGLEELISAGSLIQLDEGRSKLAGDSLLIAQSVWDILLNKTLQIIEDYHGTYPLRRGISREELKSRLKLSSRVFTVFIENLIDKNLVSNHAAFVAKTGHKIQFNAQEQVKVQTLIRNFEANPFSPPSIKECHSELGEEVVNALIELDELIPVSSDVIFRTQDYDYMVDRIRNILVKNGRITLAEVRNIFKTSRKYAQALLEHLDATSITVRNGDFRTLRK